MKREVIVAKHAGFCFGVGRAAEAVEKEIAGHAPGTRIYTLGKLIHNETYVSRLAAQGVGIASEADLDRLCAQACESAPVKVFVRAHGMTKQTEQQLLACSAKNPYFSFEDCTCVFVRKIHKIVAEHNQPDNVLFVLGAAEHPEVVGFLSRFDGEKIVFSDTEELGRILTPEKWEKICAKVPIIVAQTTQKLGEWLKTKEFIKKLYTNPIIFDTICSITEIRQKEVESLAGTCDCMIVIGSRSSSNSTKLYHISKSACKDTYLVESAAQLSAYGPFTHQRVGIAAGASTPRDIIEEVEKTMSEVIENFEELLESSLKTLNTGDVVTGTVEYVTDAEIQLDLGAGVTGYIKAEQVDDSPEKLTDRFHRGDKVDAFVIRVSDIEGVAELSKKRVDSDKNWYRIVAAKDSEEVLEGTVVEVVKGGVIVSVDSNRVFVHASQTGVPKDGDLNTILNTTVKLRIIEIRDGKRAKGSIRLVQRDERKAAQEAFWNEIEEGKTYTGVVKSMTSYGAFIDLGGVDGMVHASELSWKRIKSPADVVAIGDVLTVFVKSFDKEKKRIALGYKTAETNPWYVFTHTYAEGDVASVKIVSMMPFGAFAEIVDGVDGLIHISQIAMTKIAKPADVLEIGQIVDAKIVAIDNEKQKVNLSIRALLEEAKAELEAAPAEEAAEADAE
ncbi:MAG: 4-hydroxy-3-methylbut-2-enyl diphosphate reductase [Clostridia bacterium]|nr:4-hydroxy-3-methylbut-2-enyl diphosphate reductase [Clostridia bacterium]